MFVEFEKYIDECDDYQDANYIARLNDGTTRLNWRFIKDKRKALLEHLRGKNLEEFNNRMLLGTVPVDYDDDGFIYTTEDGKNITCIGSVLDTTILGITLRWTCIADIIAPNAFEIVRGQDYTVFLEINAPFVREIGEHAFKGQTSLTLNAPHASKEDKERAFSLLSIQDKVLLTVKEAHELFGLSEKSLYDFARNNQNSHTIIRKGRKIFFKRALFEKYITEQAEWNYGN